MKAWRSVAILAVSTLLEALRSRLLWVSVIFAVVLVGTSVAAASVALYERSRLIIDVGLAAASGMGSVVALAATLSFFAAPLQNRTAYPVLVRPLPRWAWVVGRYMGLWAAMVLVVLAMGAATAGVTILFAGELPVAFVPALGLCCMEMAVVVALALLFSTLAVPALAASYAAGVVLAGSLSGDIARLAQSHDDPQLTAVLRTVYSLLPDTGKLSLRSEAANSLPVPPWYALQGGLYALTYAGATLVLTAIIFSRRKAL